MTDIFDQELREQLVRARRAEQQAAAAGDEDGVQAFAGRVAELLRIADRHGIDLAPDAADELPDQDR
ncbi:hypothetical protein [Kitasatospora cheerisanensis]|uniref:Uncharacterized protein n=1 Tax=Kitasatospora cheerisanensis KCTC 2395 TaxID=1348663 RepID=A0A066Z108_9ACTN|nr:hypothetical protein [Kitasatospora cheerisanensis]KDN87473.1 hypothetical protein KCH_08450 [Kitasatospora cheerisanensis KCTC 2395]